MEIKKAVVIGGAGFIGSHIVENLESERIVVFDDLSRGTRENLRDVNCELHIGSILIDPLEDVLKDADVVFHLAATWLLECHINSQKGFYNNIEGTYLVERHFPYATKFPLLFLEFELKQLNEYLL